MCIVAGCWQEISVPATSSMPASAAFLRAAADAVLAVVVSQGEGRQARFEGEVYEVFWRITAVGNGRVRMQVDHRATVLCRARPGLTSPRARFTGCPPARETMGQ